MEHSITLHEFRCIGSDSDSLKVVEDPFGFRPAATLHVGFKIYDCGRFNGSVFLSHEDEAELLATLLARRERR